MPTTFESHRQISAPVDRVFRTIAEIESFKKAIPHIVEVEFLSEQRVGVGTRFKETRDMNGRKASTVLEVTEYVENEHVRIVSKAGGTVWDTVFTTDAKDGGTALQMVMEARAGNPLAWVMVKLVTKMVTGALEKDMDSVKQYCEQ